MVDLITMLNLIFMEDPAYEGNSYPLVVAILIVNPIRIPMLDPILMEDPIPMVDPYRYMLPLIFFSKLLQIGNQGCTVELNGEPGACVTT